MSMGVTVLIHKPHFVKSVSLSFITFENAKATASTEKSEKFFRYQEVSTFVAASKNHEKHFVA